MEEISKELVLTFGTAGKEVIKLTITKPGSEISGSEIKAAMDAVIAAGALGEKGEADKIVSAQYVVKQIDNIELA
ncbi:MAG: DUF2922 domain-containing protein [Cellulosilyticaceae bacterium]